MNIDDANEHVTPVAALDKSPEYSRAWKKFRKLRQFYLLLLGSYVPVGGLALLISIKIFSTNLIAFGVALFHILAIMIVGFHLLFFSALAVGNYSSDLGRDFFRGAVQPAAFPYGLNLLKIKGYPRVAHTSRGLRCVRTVFRRLS